MKAIDENILGVAVSVLRRLAQSASDYTVCEYLTVYISNELAHSLRDKFNGSVITLNGIRCF